MVDNQEYIDKYSDLAKIPLNSKIYTINYSQNLVYEWTVYGIVSLDGQRRDVPVGHGTKLLIWRRVLSDVNPIKDDLEYWLPEGESLDTFGPPQGYQIYLTKLAATKVLVGFIEVEMNRAALKANKEINRLLKEVSADE
ncbi:hypothetical protein KAR91_38695 [Candidatus Pacearchaeota archaeon]|nr:hypothetical protein [Candidatus Pacearchaeota archaeon]